MARTLPGGAGERTVLASAHVNIYARLEIKDSDGAWRDLTNLSGFDWLDKWTVEENVDDPVARGTFVLRREIGALSLAPLVQASTLNRNGVNAYVPLLTATRLLRFSVATVANGVAPIAGDYHEIFQGPIVSVDPADPEDGITVHAFDLGSFLQITMIELETQYGSGGGTAVETVMQAIINQWVLTSPPTLVTPASPGWLILTYTQARVSVLQAIRDLALQIGWDLRYMYQVATNTPELRFYQPDRAKVVPDWTFAATEYLRLSRAPLDDADVRNVCRVNYVNTSGVLSFVTRVNAGSITAFRRRFMEITEDASSNIDTLVEANAMGDAAVADLGTPPQEHEIETLLFWPLQLNDLCRFTANGVQYDQDQDLSAIGFRHEGQGGDGRTTISCRGKPCGAYSDWIRKSRVGGPIDTGEEQAPPPTAHMFLDSRVIATETVLLNGQRGRADMDPLQWQTKLDGAAWSALSSAILPQTIAIPRSDFYDQNLLLKVIQADGQATIAGPYTIPSKLQALDPATGKKKRNVQNDDGNYDVASSASDGLTILSTVNESGGKRVNRMYAKTLLSDPDNADSVNRGLLYGVLKVGALDASSNVDFAGTAWVNKTSTYLARHATDSTVVEGIIQRLSSVGHGISTFQESGGKEVRRLLAKTLASDSDSADGVPDGVSKRVTTNNEATGGGRAITALDGSFILVTTSLDFSRGYTNKTSSNLPRNASDANSVEGIIQRLSSVGHGISTFQESGGKEVRRMFAKALASDGDNLDSVPAGSTNKHVTAVTAAGKIPWASIDAAGTGSAPTLSIGNCVATNAGVTGPPYNRLEVNWSHSNMPSDTTFTIAYDNGGQNIGSDAGYTVAATSATFNSVTFGGTPGVGMVTVTASSNGMTLAVRHQKKTYLT